MTLYLYIDLYLVLVVSYHYKKIVQIKLRQNCKANKTQNTISACKGLCCFVETQLLLSI